jgi:YVTN family beta-propeller protein
MKKYFIYIVIIGLIVAFILPYVMPNSTSSETPPFSFSFTENLAVKHGESLPIPFEVSEDVSKLELSLNGKKIQSWTAPKGKITYTLNTNSLQVGAFAIEMVGFRKDGTSFSDQRLIRILSDITPEKWAVEIVSSLPHLETSFTQGLEFNEGKLFEGTGDPNQAGETVIAEVELKTGTIVRKMGLDASHFGEGITILGDELYQLTWKNQKCLVYNKSDFTSIKEFTYTGEGWGLCNDGKSLIMSDGSERIYFRSPKTFDVERTIEVYTDQGPIARLNELEYVDGLIYANIWTSNNVAVIDPATGKVIATIDATQLVQEGKGNGEVLNGIAYNSVTKKLYMTGKFWSKMFEVKVNKNVVS